jgi:hypothetical protein
MDINIDHYLDNKKDPNNSRYYGNNNEFRKISTARKIYQETPIAECLRRGEECKLVIDNDDHFEIKSSFSHTLMDEIQKEFGFDKIHLIKGTFYWLNHIEGFKTKLKKLQTNRQKPDWLPQEKMNIPSLTTHFRFSQNFSMELFNGYQHRDILELFYLNDQVKIGIFDGVQVDDGMLVGTLVIPEGATAKIGSISLWKEGAEGSNVNIKIEKGATFILNGKSVVTKKEIRLRLDLEKFNEIVCQFNRISL